MGDAASTDTGEASDLLDERVTIVPGIARYHRPGCILIRFMGEDDLESSTRGEAEQDGCVPCRACQPDKPARPS
ncbi:MAG: hypothetical protein LBI49_13200 [Nocardiopsaceae bacterium]|jgi:hypothetical protein|nr:hypothetical protein [Nocardiopsaceae bacterium]